MSEQTPKYFQYFLVVFNNFVVEVRGRFDAHAEQIARISEGVTGIKMILKQKADASDVIELKERIAKIDMAK